MHPDAIEAVHQFTETFRALLEQRFRGGDKLQFPVFRHPAAGLPNQIVIVAGLMDIAVSAFRRWRKLAAFR